MDYYKNFKIACLKNNTNITNALHDIGVSASNTGTWKNGGYPRLDTVINLANKFNMSLDELVYGDEAKAVILDDSEREWFKIIRSIPKDKQQICKDFLKTHISQPEEVPTIPKASSFVS